MFSDSQNRKLVSFGGYVFASSLFFFLLIKLAFLESIWALFAAAFGTGFICTGLIYAIEFFFRNIDPDED